SSLSSCMSLGITFPTALSLEHNVVSLTTEPLLALQQCQGERRAAVVVNELHAHALLEQGHDDAPVSYERQLRPTATMHQRVWEVAQTFSRGNVESGSLLSVGGDGVEIDVTTRQLLNQLQT